MNWKRLFCLHDWKLMEDGKRIKIRLCNKCGRIEGKAFYEWFGEYKWSGWDRKKCMEEDEEL